MSRNSAELRPQLREAQQNLGKVLKEACSMDLSNADTGELIHIDELLAIAGESAKKAISVRRRLKKDGSARAATNGQHSTSRLEAREFEADRVKWTAVAVRPSTSKSLAGPYQSGWLSFDCGTETRRLAPIPTDWASLPDDELRRLWQAAQVAPKKKSTG